MEGNSKNWRALGRGAAYTVKTSPPPYVLPRQIWSFSVKGCRHKYGRTPKIGQRRKSALLGWEVWLTLRYTPPHMYYSGKFGSSATKGVRINRREPPKLQVRWSPASLGAWLTPKTMPPPICVTTSYLVVLPPPTSNLVVMRQSLYT